MADIGGLLRDARTALKKAKRVDYYALLEVDTCADEAEIKKVGACERLLSLGLRIRIVRTALKKAKRVDCHALLEVDTCADEAEVKEVHVYAWCHRLSRKQVRGSASVADTMERGTGRVSRDHQARVDELAPRSSLSAWHPAPLTGCADHGCLDSCCKCLQFVSLVSCWDGCRRLVVHGQAYKRAALKYHPDKVPREERDEAERKFKQARLFSCEALHVMGQVSVSHHLLCKSAA